MKDSKTVALLSVRNRCHRVLYCGPRGALNLEGMTREVDRVMLAVARIYMKVREVVPYRREVKRG